jgi:hypothetical protein
MATCTAVLAEFALKQTLQSLPTACGRKPSFGIFCFGLKKLHLLEPHSSTGKIVRTIGRTKGPGRRGVRPRQAEFFNHRLRHS